MTRVAVVGAGAAGLESVRTLVAAGYEVVCFERDAQPGGHWHRDYESLHLITARDTTCFDGFPMPSSYPLFPSRDQVRDYLLAFYEHFGLAAHVRLEEEVTEVAPHGDGWRVRTAIGTDERFDAVVVANGHLWQPRLPAYAGDFAGHALHSGAYRTPDDIVGDRVLVVGAGNSGCDIAVDAAMARKTTYISMRRGQVFQPKTFFGRSRNDLPLLGHMPMWLAERVARALVRVSVGDSDDYPGLVRPPTPNLNRQPPVVNNQLLYWIQHGRISVLPEIRAIEGTSISFDDGSRLEIDTVIWATGFSASLPFLADELLRWRNGVPLRVGGLTVPLGPPGLYLVGLASPRGAQLPVYSAQARLVARMIRLAPKLERPLAELLVQAGAPDDRIDILRPIWMKQMRAASRVLDDAVKQART